MTKRAGRRSRPPAKRGAGGTVPAAAGYDGLVGGIGALLEAARHISARAVNALMTATYWEIGRRVVEYEQGGKERAEYGETLLKRLAGDLSARFGRGFGVDNLQRFRLFYLAYPPDPIYATASRISGPGPAGGDTLRILSTSPGESTLAQGAARFPLPWSAYVRLLVVKNEQARRFYETEALRSGWSVRQLDRQAQSQFYERTALSWDKAAMLTKGMQTRAEDLVKPEEEVKDLYLLELSAARETAPLNAPSFPDPRLGSPDPEP